MHFDVVRNAEARQIDVILASRAHAFDQIRLVDPEPHAVESRGKNDGERGAPGTAADDGEIFHDAFFM